MVVAVADHAAEHHHRVFRVRIERIRAGDDVAVGFDVSALERMQGLGLLSEHVHPRPGRVAVDKGGARAPQQAQGGPVELRGKVALMRHFTVSRRVAVEVATVHGGGHAR